MVPVPAADVPSVRLCRIRYVLTQTILGHWFCWGWMLKVQGRFAEGDGLTAVAAPVSRFSSLVLFERCYLCQVCVRVCVRAGLPLSACWAWEGPVGRPRANLFLDAVRVRTLGKTRENNRCNKAYSR